MLHQPKLLDCFEPDSGQYDKWFVFYYVIFSIYLEQNEYLSIKMYFTTNIRILFEHYLSLPETTKFYRVFIEDSSSIVQFCFCLFWFFVNKNYIYNAALRFFFIIWSILV